MTRIILFICEKKFFKFNNNVLFRKKFLNDEFQIRHIIGGNFRANALS